MELGSPSGLKTGLSLVRSAICVCGRGCSSVSTIIGPFLPFISIGADTAISTRLSKYNTHNDNKLNNYTFNLEFSFIYDYIKTHLFLLWIHLLHELCPTDAANEGQTHHFLLLRYCISPLYYIVHSSMIQAKHTNDFEMYCMIQKKALINIIRSYPNFQLLCP